MSSAQHIYEMMLLFPPDFSEDEVHGHIDTLKKDIAAAGGEVTFEDFWGRRKLEYPIKKQEHGYYHVMLFTLGAQALQEMEQEILLNKNILRHLITTTPKDYQPITSGEVEASEDRYWDEWRAKKAGKKKRKPQDDTKPKLESKAPKSDKPLIEVDEEESEDSKEERSKKLDKILEEELL